MARLAKLQITTDSCYDLVFSVSCHPLEDEKIFADGFFGCGGGPAANAAITVSNLGFKASFAGYLGQDIYGEKYYQELLEYGVHIELYSRRRPYPTLHSIS